MSPELPFIMPFSLLAVASFFIILVTEGCLLFYVDYVLQYLPCLALNPDEVWNEIRMAAGRVISKLCKNFCTCR